jgi:ABC-type lipoprotein release transport system permease subunit
MVCAVLIVASLAALYLPARWASRLEPAHTLRCE